MIYNFIFKDFKRKQKEIEKEDENNSNENNIYITTCDDELKNKYSISIGILYVFMLD